jgi:hypothetical protein
MSEDESSVAALARALRRYLRGRLTARAPVVGGTPGAGAIADEIRIKSLEAVVNVAADAYKENARVTAVLDDKAQKAAQTAGLFLAAGFALIKPGGENIAKYVGIPGLIAMTGAVTMLLGTVIVTLVANWLRRIPTPLNPARVHENDDDSVGPAGQ